MNSGNPVCVQKKTGKAGPTFIEGRSYSKPILQSHLDLLKEGTFSDVTFIVGPSKERIPCHQLFLKARSPVLEVMFSERWEDHKSKEVLLEDVDAQIFRKFLEFMYSDIFVANVSETLELLQIAHKYNVELLVDKCEQLLESEVTLDDAVDVFQAARKYDKIQLMHKVGDFMAKSLSKLQSLPSFSRVDKQTLMYVLRRDDLKMKEVDLFRLVLKWAQTQPVSAIEFDTLSLIRFPLMTLNEFTGEVVPTGLLSESTLVELFTYLGSDAATRKSLARTLKFNTQPRKSAGSIVSVALYSADVANMRTRRQQFVKLNECLEFVFRTDSSQTRPASSGLQWTVPSPMPTVDDMDSGNLKSIGLNGISIYCPSRAKSTAIKMAAASFKEFKILVKVQAPSDYEMEPFMDLGPNLTDLLKMPSVKADEGKITDIKFDTAVTLENQKQYYISVVEIKTCMPGYIPVLQPQSYDAKDFDNHLSPITVSIDDKLVSIQSIQRNRLQGFWPMGYEYPHLICKLSLEEF